MDNTFVSVLKWLIKLPIIFGIWTILFNIFAFVITTIKILGFSFIVMLTAIRNNYIPPTELGTLNRYLDNITNTAFVDDAGLILVGRDPMGTGEESVINARNRRQYGETVTVGVYCHFRAAMPLTRKDQLLNTSADVAENIDGSGITSVTADGATLDARREEIAENGNEHFQNSAIMSVRDAGPDEDSYNYIVFKYTVPGLEMYTDLT